MKTTFKITFFLTIALFDALAVELPYQLGDLKTLDGEEYHQVVVTQNSSAGIAVTHDSGIRNFTWDKLPTETQRLLGYNAVAEADARKKLEAELATAQAKLKEAAARLSPQQLKAALSQFTVSPANANAWRLTFSDPVTATISFSYTTPPEWFPIGGMALRREDQLKDAAAARYIQKRGGRGLRLDEVQFLSAETRLGLEMHPGQPRTFKLSFPPTHSAAISQQIARYRARFATGSQSAADFGAIGANTFGYNADKKCRLNEMSFSPEEVSILDFLVGRVPTLQQEIYRALVHE